VLRFVVVRLIALVGVAVIVAAVTWVMLHTLRADAWAFDDRPTLTQFGDYMGDVFLRGDFGFAWQNFGDQSIADYMRETVPQDVWLLGGAMVLALVMGMAGGAYCAANPGKPLTRLLMGVAAVMVITPPYVLGLGLLLLFGAGIAIIDIGIGIPTTQTPMEESLAGWFGSMIVPWIVLSLPFGAFCLRMMNGSMREVLHEDYLRTAKAKGLHDRVVLRRHAAPAAAAPVFSVLGASVPLRVTNMVLVESVFSIPGFFQDLPEYMEDGDFPIIQAMAVVIAVLVTAASFIVDAFLAWLDPVARSGGSRAN
jgi:peptide/nickel transport system permease protein